MNRKISTIILVLIIIGGLSWYLNRTYVQTGTPFTTPTLSPDSSSNTTNPQASLIYVPSGAAREIWEFDQKSGAKKIFTDADEKEKIVQFSNLAPGSNSVFAVTASNKLVSIDLNKPKIEIRQNTFSRPDNLSLSRDGKKIAYTRFSNVEENYGYTLYISGAEGEDKRIFANSQSPIVSPVWSDDNSQIAFSTTAGSESELITGEIGTADKKTILKIPAKIIDTVYWASDKIYFSIRNIGSNVGEIDSINLEGKNQEKITSFEGGITNFLTVSGGEMAYLVAQYANKLNDTTAGQIYLAAMDNSQKEPLKKGVQILGWRP